MRGNLNCAFSAVASTDSAHVLLQRGAQDSVAAHSNTFALDAEVAWVVVRTGGAVEDVLRGRVIGLLDPVEAGQLALVLWVPVPKQSRYYCLYHTKLRREAILLPQFSRLRIDLP